MVKIENMSVLKFIFEFKAFIYSYIGCSLLVNFYTQNIANRFDCLQNSSSKMTNDKGKV